MKDITYCDNEECPNKEICVRFEWPEDNIMFSVASFEPDEHGRCDYFFLHQKRLKLQ